MNRGMKSYKLPKVAKRKAPGLLSLVRGLKSTNIDYSHSIVAGGLDVMS